MNEACVLKWVFAGASLMTMMGELKSLYDKWLMAATESSIGDESEIGMKKLATMMQHKTK